MIRSRRVHLTPLVLTVGLATVVVVAGLLGAPPSAGQNPESGDPRPTTVPPGAQGPAVPEKGYRVEALGRGLYAVTDGQYYSMFMVTSKGVIAVDAPPTIGANLTKAIREVTTKPVTHVIYSHSHADHIAAAGQFPRSARRIAHEETAALLRRADDKDRPVSTVSFKRSYRLKVGGRELRLRYFGANHEPGNIFIWAPRQKTLMVVDLVFPGWVPFKGLSVSEDIPGYYAAYRHILDYPFRTFVGGHLTRLGTRADVRESHRYILDVRRSAAEALRTVDFAAVAAEHGTSNLWALYDAYLDRVTKVCEDRIVPKWKDRLGGTEVFTFDHCFTVAQSLRIDEGRFGG